MSAKKLSIIIPTLNRPRQLSRIVENVFIFCSPEIEVIVVDDSIDPWTHATTKYALIDQLKYIHRGKRMGVSSARNVGGQHSKAEYLIFLDDDDAVTESWLEDFHNSLADNPDLVYCDMRLVAPSGKVTSVSASKNSRGIVIPGAWMIRKAVFDEVGGYDECLKYAENTELFFRLDQLFLKKKYIEKENFIYHQSPDGGSKNLQNMLDSIRLILVKHDNYLTAYVKHLYHQKIGVIEIRFQRFELAKKHLWTSWKLYPRKISTLFRLALAFLPGLAKKVYKIEVRHI